MWENKKRWKLFFISVFENCIREILYNNAYPDRERFPPKTQQTTVHGYLYSPPKAKVKQVNDRIWKVTFIIMKYLYFPQAHHFGAWQEYNKSRNENAVTWHFCHFQVFQTCGNRHDYTYDTKQKRNINRRLRKKKNK